MNRDPLGLGTLLYAMRPDPAYSLTAAAWVVGPLAEREWNLAHADCNISVFCRNPLHPGPCKGWRKSLGHLAPGALTALDKAQKAKVAERRAAREQARSTAAGRLTKRELASPLHAKKSVIKNAEIIQGKAGDAATRRADRVKLTKPEIARYGKLKSAQLDALAAKHGVASPVNAQHIADALATDNASGRDMAFRATMETASRKMAEDLAKKICQKGDGDCDGKPYEDLQHALEEGFRDAVTHGDEDHLSKLISDRAAGTLLKPTGHHTYEATQPKPARPAPAPKGPSAAQQAHAAKVARQQAAAKAITPPANAAPAAKKSAVDRVRDVLKAPVAATSDGDLLDALDGLQPHEFDHDLDNNQRLAISSDLRSMLKSKDATVRSRARAHEKKFDTNSGLPLGQHRHPDGSIGPHPRPAGAATPAAAAPAVQKHVGDLQDLLAKGGYTDAELLDSVNNVTKAEHDTHLSAAEKADLAAELKAMSSSSDPDVKRNAKLTAVRLAKGGPPTKAAPASPAPPRGQAGFLSDQALVNAVKMHGSTSGDGKKAADELDRRGLDLDGKPKAAAAPAGALPTAGAPLPATASADAKHAHEVANRSAHRAGTAKTQLDAYGKLTKDEFDALPDGTKQQIIVDLEAAEAKFIGPRKKDAHDTLTYLQGQTNAVGAPAASKATPSAPAAAAPTPAAPSVPAAPAAPAPVKQALAPAVSRQRAQDLRSALSGGDRGELIHVAQQLDQTDLQHISNADVQSLHKALSDMVQVPGHAPATPAAAQAVLDKLGLKKLHGREEAFAKLKTETNPTEVYKQLQNQQLAVLTPEQRKEFDAALEHIGNNPDHPAWLRAAAKTEHSDGVFSKQVRDAGYAADQAAEVANQPQNFPTTYSVRSMVALDQKQWDALPELQRQAIREQTGAAIKKILGGSHATVAKREEISAYLFPLHSVRGTNKRGQVTLERYNRLDDDGKKSVRGVLEESIQNALGRGQGNFASERQDALDRIDNRTYNADQNSLIDSFSDVTSSIEDRTLIARATTRADFDGLPAGHKELVLSNLERFRDNRSLTWEDRSKAATELARLQGKDPGEKYADDFTKNAIRTATIHKDITPPEWRGMAYSFFDQKRYDSLNPADQDEVRADAQMIADATNPAITPPLQFSVQRNLDKWDGVSYQGRSSEAIKAADPSARAGSMYTDPLHRLTAYDRLDQSEYNALPKAYRAGIREDVESELNGPEGQLAAKVMKTIDPSWAPPAITNYAVTTNASPHVQAALDIIYGNDPKGKQLGRQMQVYGTVSKGDFDGLQPHEQQTLLADLSFIATTSSSATTQKSATKLLDRFTPPGTPVGTSGSPAIVPPHNAVVGQTRLPDPKGQTGLLTTSSSPGKRGDEWVKTAAGGEVWGKYGAAGLLLRHVDDQGVERYLMAERGPGISNPGKWQFPGGAIESLEKPYEGGTRETLEELGFKDSDLLDAAVHGHHEATAKLANGKDWKYTSVAATVKTQLKPDLSTASARAETSDARWMTRQEIENLDKSGKLLKPLANGQLQANVMSLFPSGGQSVGRPGPLTQRPPRAAPPRPFKASTAKNLIPTAADHDAISQLVKGPGARGRFAGKVADERLATIHEAQGFDRTPTVVSKADMDALLATGDYIEIWRGVKGIPGKSATDIAEEFRSGPSYGGFGVFGNGYYFAGDKAIANDYAGGGWRGGGVGSGAVIRALIPKSASIITYDKLDQEQRGHFDSRLDRQRFSSKGGRTLHDEGRYASSKGHDSIEVSVRKYKSGGGSGHLATKPVHVVQNRSILIVQEA